MYIYTCVCFRLFNQVFNLMLDQLRYRFLEGKKKEISSGKC